MVLIIILLALLAAGLYWFFVIRDSDDAAEQGTAIVGIPAEATECEGGIYVTGKWDCAYGQAVADALNNVPPDLKTPDADVSVTGVFDAVTETSYSMVCRMATPVECLWSEADKVFITTQ